MKTKIRVPKRVWMALQLMLVAIAAWIVAGAIGRYAEYKLLDDSNEIATNMESSISTAASSRAARDYNLILRRNIFNSEQTEIESLNGGNVAIKINNGDIESAPKTALNLRLLGTVANETGDHHFAAIENKDDGKSDVYQLNETVLNAKIVKISRNKVYLLRNGNTEVLTLDLKEKPGGFGKKTASMRMGARLAPGSDVIQMGEGDFLVSDRYIKGQLANMSRILTEVRAVPNIGKDGVAHGFKLFSIKKGSIFEKIGLKNHDVIERVNGVELDSAEKGLELFQALRNEKSFSVDLLRRNTKKSFSFNIQ